MSFGFTVFHNIYILMSQEEEPGLRMLPSAFLEDLEKGHKTFSGKDESKTYTFMWYNSNTSASRKGM